MKCDTILRSRKQIVVVLAGVICIGLASRLCGHELPRLIAKDLGDMLWSSMFLFLVLLWRPRSAGWFAAIGAMAVASFTEFLKLYHAGWIEAIRSHTIGAFLLGRDFQWGNLIAYAVGCGTGLILDQLIQRPMTR